MEQETKTLKINANRVELILDESVSDSEKDAFASLINRNPNVTWVKMILTDNRPNGNKKRIPKSEYANILKTGSFMPIKMANGYIEPDHSKSGPIGALTNLRVIDTQIEALAALWEKEAPESIKLIKEKYSKNEPIDISWEITYTDKEEEDDGVVKLLGVSMNAATVVGIPAYKGRTPITAVASETEEKPMEQINKADHDQVVADLNAKITELKAELDTLRTEKSSLEGEVTELKNFKDGVEQEKEKEARTNELKAKFEEAGLTLDEENIEKYLSMETETLEFVLQELVAFASKEENKNDDEASISITGTKVPQLKTEAPRTRNDILEALRNLDKPAK